MFTKILYINLERRQDRKEYMENQIKKIKWNGAVERINAVDGRSLDIDSVSDLLSHRAALEAKDNTPREFAPGSVMTKGAVGCALSHREAWLNIHEGNHEKVLVLEDDAYFNEDFLDKLNESLKKVPDYDLLYLGHHDARQSIEHNEILMKSNYLVFGLFGYVVDKRISLLLLNMYPINGQVDSEIRKIYPLIKTYHFKDDFRLIFSDHSYTNNLGTDIQLIEGFDTNSNNTNTDTNSNNTNTDTNSNNTEDNYYLKEIIVAILVIFLIYTFLGKKLF